ncbi:MAG: hypothetical protein H6Q65_1399 [Firmicutes bacterium]|nr:hypothetical protein [Bacillota bacterium]
MDQVKVEILILGEKRINRLMDFNQRLNLADNREYDLDTAAAILLGMILNDNAVDAYFPHKKSID